MKVRKTNHIVECIFKGNKHFPPKREPSYIFKIENVLNFDTVIRIARKKLDRKGCKYSKFKLKVKSYIKSFDIQ